MLSDSGLKCTSGNASYSPTTAIGDPWASLEAQQWCPVKCSVPAPNGVAFSLLCPSPVPLSSVLVRPEMMRKRPALNEKTA